MDDKDNIEELIGTLEFSTDNEDALMEYAYRNADDLTFLNKIQTGIIDDDEYQTALLHMLEDDAFLKTPVGSKAQAFIQENLDTYKVNGYEYTIEDVKDRLRSLYEERKTI